MPTLTRTQTHRHSRLEKAISPHTRYYFLIICWNVKDFTGKQEKLPNVCKQMSKQELGEKTLLSNDNVQAAEGKI